MGECAGLLNSEGLPEDLLSPKKATELFTEGKLLESLDRCLAWSRSGDPSRKKFEFILIHMLGILETCDAATVFLVGKLQTMSLKLRELEECWGSRPTSSEDVSVELSIPLAKMIRRSKLYSDLQDGALNAIQDAMSPRTCALFEILDKLQATLDPKATVMLFCTTRAGAISLTEVINHRFGGTVDLSSAQFCPKADFIIGHGNRDSETRGMTPDEQIYKSRAFKKGEFNVLVSTSVCKEGIDVGSCKVGIEHGGLISSTELTQFMGRVRAKEGTIYVIGDATDKIRIEKLFAGRERFAEALPQAVLKQTLEFSGKHCSLQRQFVESDALYVLQKWSENISGNGNAFSIEVVKAKPSYPKMVCYVATATISIGHGVSSRVEGENRSTEEAAIRSAAYRVCTKLLEAGHDLPQGPHFMTISSRGQARKVGSSTESGGGGGCGGSCGDSCSGSGGSGGGGILPGSAAVGGSNQSSNSPSSGYGETSSLPSQPSGVAGAAADEGRF